MTLQDQQNFMARLFTDEALREAFFDDPEKASAHNRLSAEDISMIKGIVKDDLDFFAKSLVNKRIQEAGKLLPFTLQALGKRNFADSFKKFAPGYNTHSIKKHLDDSIEFCGFLMERELSQRWLSDAIKFDQANLLFNSGRRRFIFRILRYDLLFGEERIRKHPHRRLTFALWIRAGTWARRFVW